jgi:hypothetical protein
VAVFLHKDLLASNPYGCLPQVPCKMCYQAPTCIYYFNYYTGQSFLAGLTVPMDEPVVHMCLMYRIVTAPKPCIGDICFLAQGAISCHCKENLLCCSSITP